MTKQERRETVLNMWAAKTPASDIADAIGAHHRPQLVHEIVRFARAKGDPRAIPGFERGMIGRRGVSPDGNIACREKILDAWAKGEKQSHIATALRISASYVADVINRARIECDPRAIAVRAAEKRRLAIKQADAANDDAVFVTEAGNRILARLNSGNPVDEHTLFHASLCPTYAALRAEIATLAADAAMMGREIVQVGSRYVMRSRMMEAAE
jgi:hypothetical protein